MSGVTVVSMLQYLSAVSSIICNKHLDAFGTVKAIYVVNRPKYFVSLAFPTLKRDCTAVPVFKRGYAAVFLQDNFLHHMKVAELIHNATGGIML